MLPPLIGESRWTAKGGLLDRKGEEEDVVEEEVAVARMPGQRWARSYGPEIIGRKKKQQRSFSLGERKTKYLRNRMVQYVDI